MRDTQRRPAATGPLLVVSAALLTGCAATDGLMSSVTMPATESTHADAGQLPPRTPGAPPSPHGKLAVSDHQRSYLDALHADGLTPSSELMALRIGSSICQARAAGQSDQAVWEFVSPLVRTDLENVDGTANAAGATPTAHTPVVGAVQDATADYIRIATERLC